MKLQIGGDKDKHAMNTPGIYRDGIVACSSSTSRNKGNSQKPSETF